MKGVTKAALYMRLSKDDEQFGDSISIETQRYLFQGHGRGTEPNRTEDGADGRSQYERLYSEDVH